eukprot:793922-Amphidinium_carterae.1
MQRLGTVGSSGVCQFSDSVIIGPWAGLETDRVYQHTALPLSPNHPTKANAQSTTKLGTPKNDTIAP